VSGLGWCFETDPSFAEELAWVEKFVSAEVEPLDHLVGHPLDLSDPVRQRLIPPLQQRVQERGLWAAHLEQELGGQGYGQLRLALMNEVLGRSRCAPTVFGCQAPDSGNAEILARFGSPQIKERYLQPLLDNTVVSAFSMTEPRGGSDPLGFVTQAVLEGDEWVVNGEKWFTSHACFAEFLIVLAVTEPDEPGHRRMSMFVVPASTPGVEIVRNVGLYGEQPGEGSHSYVRYRDVRIPRDHLLGGRGEGFLVAQTRLGGGRIHHAMRTVGMARRALDAMCERVLSRETKGTLLADKQLAQAMIADSHIELEQFRLLVLQTAWKIDKLQDYRKVRADIAAVKIAMPRVLHDIAGRALQLHGSLGASEEMPFGAMILEAFQLGLVDGATELHKITLARDLLAHHTGTDQLFPSQHLPTLRQAARDQYADQLRDLL
jgi:acyl-CoA dehydrogenase